MLNIEFLPFSQINPEELCAVLNQAAIRTHLIEHPYFNEIYIQEWMLEKQNIDNQTGCCIRAVIIDDTLAGWCGIQPDDEGFELAIVISKAYWGAGIAIFKTLIQWAQELGHNDIVFHLLDSRAEYKALKKMAIRTHTTEMLGRQFTTYHIAVPQR